MLIMHISISQTCVSCVEIPPGNYLIKSAVGTGYYLDLDSKNNGDIVRLNALGTATTDNTWVVDFGIGNCPATTLKNIQFGTYLDADYWNTDNNGCKVQGWELSMWANYNNKRWCIKKISELGANKYRCRVSNWKSPAMVLDAQNDGASNSPLVLRSNNNADNSQEFIFERL